MSADVPSLTAVIPAYNAVRLLPACARQLQQAAADGIVEPETTQLIVVDDGSTDGTSACAEELLAPVFPGLRVIRFDSNAGKGAAVRAGVAAADAPVVLFMDVDMSVEPSDIPALVDALRCVDVAIGSRSVAESVVESFNVQRRIMGRTFNRFVQAVTGLPFLDTQCGIKAFRTPLARLLFHLTNARRFAFDVELLFLARQLGLDVGEVAVYWHEKQESSVRLLMDPLSMVRDVTNLRLRAERPAVAALAAPSRGHGAAQSEKILRDVCQSLGCLYPIVRSSDTDVLALLPLCDDGAVHAVARRLRRTAPEWDVEARSIPFNNLRELLGHEQGVERVEATAPSDRTFVATPNDLWEAGPPNGHDPVARARPA